MRSLKDLFSIGKILFITVSIFVLTTIYLFLITEHIVVSMLVGVVSMVFGFYHSFYLTGMLKRRFQLLKELQKYATSMTYYMRSGHNVLNSLSMSRENLDPEVKRDIELTMLRLEEDAVLDTSHFKKYHFNALNIFHEILEIKYNEGGDAKELFARANKNINFEIVKHDELLRAKNNTKRQLMFFLLIVLSMPLIFRFMAYELQQMFLSTGWMAIGLNVLLFLGALISLYFIQRNATDISIYK